MSSSGWYVSTWLGAYSLECGRFVVMYSEIEAPEEDMVQIVNEGKPGAGEGKL